MFVRVEERSQEELGSGSGIVCLQVVPRVDSKMRSMEATGVCRGFGIKQEHSLRFQVL